MTPRNTVIEGDALHVLRGFAPDSVASVVTSPPYFQARLYRAGSRELGHEAHVAEWVENLRQVSAEIARVLAPWGSYFLNVGDLYSGHQRFGAPRKSLLLAPERLAHALLADGWLLRNKIAYVKTTPLPSPVTDRLTNGWEPIFHLVRKPSYFYDLDAIREPLKSRRKPSNATLRTGSELGRLARPRIGLDHMAREGRSGHPLGKNPTDVWVLSPGRRVEGHQATFPEALARRPILATTPRHICDHCGQPWRRSARRVQFLEGAPQPRAIEPCGCGAPTTPGLVLDPFAGSGTALKVARDLGRDAVGIELNPVFADLARRRAGLEAVA